jgi:type IV secretory pathway TraG/TraD family ATPase VirD4
VAKQTGVDPLAAVRAAARQAGGVYLGLAADGSPRFARRERAVLVLGPPRSGKTSAVIVPALIAHNGPAVSTSTKPDVAQATSAVRSRGGQTWVFDPTGVGGGAGGSRELRWSPVTGSRQWDEALLMARAMTSHVGVGTTDQSHWASRAQALLAPLLHAAAVHGRGMDAVVGWVMRHELDEPGVLLEDQRCSQLAFGSLVGIFNTEERERSSIFSAAADALQAYSSESALEAARDPNFDAAAFVRTADTVYIHAPAERQAAAAPIVCGLLSEIRRATYRAYAKRELSHGRVLFALDEVANIAPLEELPQIASEGGGQGLTLLAALQDLSQARQRWGAAADGFLTLFGTKLILTGVADPQTLEAISKLLGEYDRRVVSQTQSQTGVMDALVTRRPVPPPSTTYSTQRTRVLSPGEVASIPAGRGLHLDGVRWELLTLTPAYLAEPWRTLTATARA